MSTSAPVGLNSSMKSFVKVAPDLEPADIDAELARIIENMPEQSQALSESIETKRQEMGEQFYAAARRFLLQAAW